MIIQIQRKASAPPSIQGYKSFVMEVPEVVASRLASSLSSCRSALVPSQSSKSSLHKTQQATQQVSTALRVCGCVHKTFPAPLCPTRVLFEERYAC
jgi:hypothetical protein